MSEEVSNSSEIIGKLLIMASRFDDAEIYITQSIRINSNLLLQKQIDSKSSIELLKEIYSYQGDSLKSNYLDEQLDIISKADTLNNTASHWDPLTYGLDNILSINSDSLPRIDTLYFQSMNLISIANSYFSADLYFDAILNLLKAVSIDHSNISIEFLNNYLSQNEANIPYMINKLMNYSTQDSIYIEIKDIILSVIHSYIGEDGLANNYINNSLSSHSVDPRAYQLKGDYHLKAKDYLSALFSYRKSDQIDNSNIYSLYKQSICLYELGKYDEVISILRKVIHLDSYHYKLHIYIRGLSYSSTKNYRNAIRDFTDHILINPDNEDTYYYLGICYFNIKQYHRAKESLERYLKINRENPEAHYYLGMIYENILDTDNAISHYSSSRKINNKLSEPNLRLGMLHYRQQNYNKALEPLRDYVIQNPDSLNVFRYIF